MTIEDFFMPEFNMNMQVSVQLPRNWRELENKIKMATEIAARHVETDGKRRIAEWPAVDTGATMNSINARRDDAEGLSWKIGPSTEYAPFIEYGTVYMRARPFMTPALESEGPRFVEAMRQVINELDQAPPGSVRLV
tara:strand:+ start:1074 stop:1484 length:411 start_codon:yes stop_codon:yes gene_type:complete